MFNRLFKVLYCHAELIVWFVLIDFSLSVKAATLIFISGSGSAISSAKDGKSGFIYNLLFICDLAVLTFGRVQFSGLSR